jgi:hypothetical protein
MRIFVDPWSIEKEEKLSVVSVGRDEQMRFWDGLLGIDWIGMCCVLFYGYGLMSRDR